MNDRQEQAAAARKLAGDIADLLADTLWEVVPSPDVDYDVTWCDVREVATGAQIRISVGGWGNEGRVRVVGIFPKYASGHSYQPSDAEDRGDITCDAKRTPASIVKDIRRRCLKHYLPAFAVAKEFVAEQDRFVEENNQVSARLASIGAANGEVRDRSNPYYHHVKNRVYSSLQSVYEVEVVAAHRHRPGGEINPQEVHLSLRNLDPETAAQVLTLVREAEERKSNAVEKLTRVAQRIFDERFVAEMESEDEEVELRLQATPTEPNPPDPP